MAKRLVAVDQMTNGEVEVEYLAGVDNSVPMNKLGQSWAKLRQAGIVVI